MDEGQRQQRIEELLNEAVTLFNAALKQTIESDGYQEIKKAFVKECGVKVVGHQIELNVLVEQIGAAELQADDAVGDTKSSGFRIEHQISFGDKIVAHGLGIEIKPEDLKELEGNLDGARKEGLTVQQPKLLPGPQVKSQSDPRINSQIINDIKTAVQKLEPDLRRAVAKRINKSFDLCIPTSNDLKADTFWLQQIQTVINHIKEVAGADDKIKGVLLYLENIIREGGFDR